MKKCPACEREYDDNMRFCQTDGTPLVEKSEPVDPYKTVVASKADILSAIPPEPARPEPPMPEPSVPAPLENEILEIPPANDPNKTQFVSEAELRAEMEKHSADENVIEISPATDDAPSEIPITGDAASMPPPSPFSTPNAPPSDEPGPASFPTSPPIPSPFNAMPKAPEPEPPSFAQAEPPAAEVPLVNPFEKAQAAPMVQADFNPPASPEPNMQNPQNFGQNPVAGGKQNQTLAIVSLVLGILGMTLCCGLLIPNLAAIITGFMARNKANSDPSNYGGAGLALGGIITGIVGLLGSLGYLIFVFFLGGMQLIMQGMG